MIRLTLVACLAFGMFGYGKFHPPAAARDAKGTPPPAKVTDLQAGVAKVEITLDAELYFGEPVDDLLVGAEQLRGHRENLCG